MGRDPSRSAQGSAKARPLQRAARRPLRGRVAALLAVPVLLAGAVLLALPGMARGQGAPTATVPPPATVTPSGTAPAASPAASLLVWRNQFDALPDRPQRALPAGPAVTVTAERWRVDGVRRLRVVSPDPAVAAVLRFAPAQPPAAPSAAQAAGEPAVGSAPAGDLRLFVTVVAHPSVPGYQVESHGQLLRDGARVPQPHYPLGEQGIETALAGTSGRVTQIVIQDRADVELRLRRTGDTLELQVVPPAQGGLPSGLGPPYYQGRPLRFSDATVLGAASKTDALAVLIVRDRGVLRLNALFPAGTSTQVLRVLATAQAWRSDRWALWLEGGAGVVNASGSSATLSLAAGLGLHWRYKAWGVALNAGRVGSQTVLGVLGGWQLWRRVGLVAGWQRVPGGSGVAVGAGWAF